MRIFKKKAIIIFLMLVMAFALFSCGNKEGVGSGEESVSESTSVTADEDGNIVENVQIKDGEFKRTLSQPFEKENISKKYQKNIDAVKSVLESADLEKDSKIFECNFGDVDSDVSVWSLIHDKNGETLDNYGIIIRYKGKNFLFADVCHGNNPTVDVDEEKGRVLFAGGVVEGTGTHVEGLYVFDVKGENVERTAFIDPFEVQNYFVDKMSYEVNANDIKFKLGRKVISEVINTEDGEGTMRSLAVGDQIAYEIDDEHNIIVNVTPGIEFVTVRTVEDVEKDMQIGSDGEKIVMNNPAGMSVGTTTVLYYDNMPVFSMDVKLKGANASFDKIRVAE
ncbi:MAG: hypothetical protein IKP66_03075 [Lachnospiraceae bacterium]|nr:hypothetical protein [Lachnospiraceae bacterium]